MFDEGIFSWSEPINVEEESHGSEYWTEEAIWSKKCISIIGIAMHEKIKQMKFMK